VENSELRFWPSFLSNTYRVLTAVIIWDSKPQLRKIYSLWWGVFTLLDPDPQAKMIADPCGSDPQHCILHNKNCESVPVLEGGGGEGGQHVCSGHGQAGGEPRGGHPSLSKVVRHKIY
jgi:hypothetical protein